MGGTLVFGSFPASIPEECISRCDNSRSDASPPGELAWLEADLTSTRGLPSAGGHLRLSGKYEDGWFFGWTDVQVRDGKAVFQIHALDGEATPLSAWAGRAAPGPWKEPD